MTLEIPYAVAPGYAYRKQQADAVYRVICRVLGRTDLSFVPSDPGPGVIGFGVDSGVRTLSFDQILSYPFPDNYLRVAFNQEAPRTPWSHLGVPDDKVLYLDTETHNAGRQWDMDPNDFFRLGQYAWGPTGEVILTEDRHEILHMVESAEGIVAHNGHPFDLSTLYGTSSTRPLELARENRIFDTMVYGVLNVPAPAAYVNRAGGKMSVIKPEQTLKWLSLDNLCFQFGLQGKVSELKVLAKKYNPKGCPDKELDYSLIPLDDPLFLEYAVQDVVALQQLTSAMMVYSEPSDYDWREQLNAAIDAQNSRNGFKVDLAVAKARVDYLAGRKEAVLAELEKRYGFPTEGKMPWRTTAGKQAILDALKDFGIVPEEIPTWPLTDTGNISLGGKPLREFTANTPAQDLGEALAELSGQRSLSSLALSSAGADGFAHPDITALQRSGRKSTTRPGLTTWSSKGSISIEKAYFVPDTEEHSLVAFDFSNADQRVLAAYSGDELYTERFRPGVDGHEINARLMFGDELFDNTPLDDDGQNPLREAAKAPGHAYTYGGRPRKLAAITGLPLEATTRFVNGMEKRYPALTRWQNQVRAEGQQGFIVNAWGRVMPVDPEHAFTGAPALYGQSGTREIVVDALIRMLDFDMILITWLKAQVHDELIMCIPNSELEWAVPKIKELMECTWQPPDGSGQPIEFVVKHGSPAENWQKAGH